MAPSPSNPLPILVALVLVAGLLGRAQATETTVDELRAGDRVVLELSRGGTLVGHAHTYDGQCLGLMTDEGLVRVEDEIIASIVVEARTSDAPLPRIESPTTEEAIKRVRRARRRARGLAVASFFLPGLGLAATGHPGLGALYLGGVLVVDALVVLSIVLNWDYVGAIALGGLEVSARVTSAGLAYQSGLRAFAAAVPAGEGQWAGVVGIVLRL